MQIKIHVHDKLYTDANQLIEDYIPFIIQCISSTTNRYVSTDNDDEFSIGLTAFYEAITRFNTERGDFLPFAKLVIKSRLNTYLSSQNKHSILDSLDDENTHLKVDTLKAEYLETSLDSSDILSEEIATLNTFLADFKFDLHTLSTESPKHHSTRQNAIDIGEKVSLDPPLTAWLYLKKRLPISQIALKYSVTQKVLKGSKKFIITVVIIFDKNLRNLKLWLRK
ncbi:MAG: hypothetical protein ACRCWY_01115 [Cellulosilyticaceae bacterium]